METRIETAIRIIPAKRNQDAICVQSNVCNNTIELGNSQCFSVQHAFPYDCEQERLFHAAVSPLINFLQEGCDVSIVVVGQVGSGKTFTLFGPGFNCASSECEYGIVPRFIRELFARVDRSSERHCAISITWSQICGDTVQDLISCGRIDCKSVSAAFELIQFGLTNIAPRCAHTLFTVTLEQQWVMDNVIQHRMATASFAELASSDKIVVFDSIGAPQSIPSDANLLALQKCVLALTAQCAHPVQVPYHESVLTTLLRDSFGGRAKTLVIGCVSPLFGDLSETFYTLQFVSAAQLIRNTVTVNSFISNEVVAEPGFDAFALKFAANQLLKLVLDAEELFQRLMVQNALRQCDLDQIAQWLLLKQECDECLSEGGEQRRSLERIDEEAECSDDSDLASDETDEDAWTSNLSGYLETFRINTEHMVAKTCSVCALPAVRKASVANSGNSYHSKGARGRRQSIHSTSDLEGSTQLVAIKSQPENADANDASSRKRQLRHVSGGIESIQKEMGELERTIAMKESLVQRLRKNQSTAIHARSKIASQLDSLKVEYQSARSRAHENGTCKAIVKAPASHEISDIEQKMREMESVSNVTEDSTRRVLELESSLHTSRKQLEKLRRIKRREEKKRDELEATLRQSPSEQAKMAEAAISSAAWLQINCANSAIPIADDLEAVGHEIRNLRRTREFLIEQRCLHNGGASITRIINDLEEREHLQYEEAIEAIDLAIEYKNELMCGHELIITTSDKVSDQILLDRLLKLKENEMRVLLHRYFEKVVDLRYNSKKMEVQLMNAECENEGLHTRLQNLSHTLRQVRLESERRIVSMQQQHEDKLHVVMKHIANDPNGQRVVSRVLERSKQAALSMHVGNANKQVDKSSFIARFSRYASARHESASQPGQVQGRDGTTGHPQTRVTRQKTKLIITQTKPK